MGLWRPGTTENSPQRRNACCAGWQSMPRMRRFWRTTCTFINSVLSGCVVLANSRQRSSCWKRDITAGPTQNYSTAGERPFTNCGCSTILRRAYQRAGGKESAGGWENFPAILGGWRNNLICSRPVCEVSIQRAFLKTWRRGQTPTVFGFWIGSKGARPPADGASSLRNPLLRSLAIVETS